MKPNTSWLKIKIAVFQFMQKYLYCVLINKKKSTGYRNFLAPGLFTEYAFR